VELALALFVGLLVGFWLGRRTAPIPWQRPHPDDGRFFRYVASGTSCSVDLVRLTMYRASNDSRLIEPRPGTNYDLRREPDGKWSMRETRDSEDARIAWLRKYAAEVEADRQAGREYAFSSVYADGLKEIEEHPPQWEPLLADEAERIEAEYLRYDREYRLFRAT